MFNIIISRYYFYTWFFNININILRIIAFFSEKLSFGILKIIIRYQWKINIDSSMKTFFLWFICNFWVNFNR